MNYLDPRGKTPQEIFDFVVRAVVAQGRPSLSARGDCAYRGEEGARCAAGFLLTDDEVDQYNTGYGFFELPIADELPRDILLVVGHLQNAHDRASLSDKFVDTFLSACRQIANEWDLTMPRSSASKGGHTMGSDRIWAYTIRHLVRSPPKRGLRLVEGGAFLLSRRGMTSLLAVVSQILSLPKDDLELFYGAKPSKMKGLLRIECQGSNRRPDMRKLGILLILAGLLGVVCCSLFFKGCTVRF